MPWHYQGPSPERPTLAVQHGHAHRARGLGRRYIGKGPFPRNGSSEGMTTGPIQRFQQGYSAFGGSSSNPSQRFGQQHGVKRRGSGRPSIYEAGVFGSLGPDQDLPTLKSAHLAKRQIHEIPHCAKICQGIGTILSPRKCPP